MVNLNGKELKIVATAAVSNVYGAALSQYIGITLEVLKNHPVDMIIFSEDGEIRSAGRFLFDNGENKFEELDETTILVNKESGLKVPRTIWFKVDDYDDYYVGTFLFPEDY